MVLTNIVLNKSESLHQLNNKLYDYIVTKIDFPDTKDKKTHTILVDIDEKSLKEFGQWPWPRVVMANLLQEISADHPGAIGLDIIFPEKDRTSPKNIASFYRDYFHLEKSIVSLPSALLDNDLIFAKVLKDTKSLVGINLSSYPLNYDECKIPPFSVIQTTSLTLPSYSFALCNTNILQKSAPYIGSINTNTEGDGIVRRMPLLFKYKEQVIPSFSLSLLSIVDPGMTITANKFTILDRTIITNNDSSFFLHFYPDSWYKKVSAVDLLKGRVDSSILQGKIVIIGSSAVGLHDHLIRTNGVKTIGSKIHMTMIDNLINNEIIIEPLKYQYINIAIATLLGLLLLYLLIKNQNILMVILILGSLILYTFATHFMLLDGVYISSAYFYLPFLLSFIFISISFMIIDSYHKRLYGEELDRSHVALLDSMVHVAEVHDIETGAHIMRTKKYIKLLSEHIFGQKKHPYYGQLSKLSIEMMYRTAPLHDIGKVGIPDSILKKPGKLTFLEYEVMKSHPDIGRHIIKNAMNSYEENEFFIMAINIAYTHHEKWDGTGYPQGLKEEEIPLEGRLMALADVYDALVNKRVYKKAFSYEETYTIIEEGRGVQFDPLLVDAFFEIKEKMRETSEYYTDEHI